MILIIDFGSQFTQLIARRIREFEVAAEIIPFSKAATALAGHKFGTGSGSVQGIVLSGGPCSVYDPGAPRIDASILPPDVPVLGICYGVQLLNKLFGGEVSPAKIREYGFETIASLEGLQDRHPIGVAARSSDPEAKVIWMSHGDEITALAPGFEINARTSNGAIAAISHTQRPIFGLQFHPEVQHCRLGREMLKHFVEQSCRAPKDWSPRKLALELQEKVRAQVDSKGPQSQVICALSGGVDSCVAATLVHRAIGARLHCLFIDNGLLRKDEYRSVLATLETLNLPVRGVDASELFLSRLAGISDPEQKRKIIGATFIDVFEREAKRIPGAKFLVQGTLYTDVIESVPVHGSSVTIKSHHNVGGLPERMDLELVEPLRLLFKDEVRRLGADLGIAQDVLMRHPFPGPGLAIRVLGILDQTRLEVLRAADAIFVDELRKASLYDKVWQAFCVLLPIQTVGVMGDGRTYENVLALRAVNATDGMTANWSPLPHDFLGRVSSRIVNEVRGVNRIVYDITSKPPATIEWE